MSPEEEAQLRAQLAAARQEMTFDADTGEYGPGGPTIAVPPVTIDMDEPLPQPDWDSDPNPTNHVPAIAAAKQRAKEWLAARTGQEFKENNEKRLQAVLAGKEHRESPEVDRQLTQEVSKLNGIGPVYNIAHAGVQGAQGLLHSVPEAMGLPGMGVQLARWAGQKASGKASMQDLSNKTRQEYELKRSEDEVERARAAIARLKEAK
jgi:hypothetical protein